MTLWTTTSHLWRLIFLSCSLHVLLCPIKHHVMWDGYRKCLLLGTRSHILLRVHTFAWLGFFTNFVFVPWTLWHMVIRFLSFFLDNIIFTFIRFIIVREWITRPGRGLAIIDSLVVIVIIGMRQLSRTLAIMMNLENLTTYYPLATKYFNKQWLSVWPHGRSPCIEYVKLSGYLSPDNNNKSHPE